ncbi:hypothetical protein ACFXTN_028575 [Malus domestica]
MSAPFGGPIGSNSNAAGAQPNRDPNMTSAEQLVLELSNPQLCENALLELSKKRELFQDLAIDSVPQELKIGVKGCLWIFTQKMDSGGELQFLEAVEASVEKSPNQNNQPNNRNNRRKINPRTITEALKI